MGRLTFSEYQEAASKTAVYPNVGNNPIYPTLGLCGEVGEVAEKVKKVIRDRDGSFDTETCYAIALEISDVLWYVSQLARELDWNLECIAQLNLAKLEDRQARNKLHGSGDER